MKSVRLSGDPLASLAGIDEIIDRGDREEYVELLHAIIEQPTGPVVDRVRALYERVQYRAADPEFAAWPQYQAAYWLAVAMGQFRAPESALYANIEVENLFAKRTVPLTALVDSGAVFLSVPEHIAVQLGFDLTEASNREVVLANGHRQAVPMIGPLRVRFADRFCDLSALVLGDEALLGAIPMEMMDLVLHPATRTLSVNPDSPYVPGALAK